MRFSHIDKRWFLFAPSLAGATLIIAAITWSLPPVSGGVMIALAVALAAATSQFIKLESRLQDRQWQSYLTLLAGVGLPALLGGFALAMWTAGEPRFDWGLAIATVAALCMCTAGFLNGRLISVVVANLALWMGPALVLGTVMSFSALALASIGACLICIRRAREEAAEHELEMEREHEQQRAKALLVEYEASGQGWFWETDRRGMLTYISPRIAKLLRADPEALYGKPFTDLFILDTGRAGIRKDPELPPFDQVVFPGTAGAGRDEGIRRALVVGQRPAGSR